METDNSASAFDLPLFSLLPSLGPTPAQRMVVTSTPDAFVPADIPSMVVTSPAPLCITILAPPSVSRAPLPFVYQPIWLPTPPPIASTLAQDLGPLSQGLIPPPSTITPSSCQGSASLL